MKKSVGIKNRTKNLIRMRLFGEKTYTKQQIILKTDLSVSGCDTYLNEIDAIGEVIGKRKNFSAGCYSVVYSVNEGVEILS
jgi:hypothetical protein